MQAFLSKASPIHEAASEEKNHPADLRTMALTADLVSLSLRLEADPGPDPNRVPLSDGELQVLSERLYRDAVGRPLWVFAYGSLIWNPIILSVESRKARIEGWRRSFCLATVSGRGSPDNPGLVLGLDAGGACDGVALRLEEEDVVHELEILWRREMVAEAYIPRWVDLLDEEGTRFGSGIAFTMNPQANTYAGGLSREATVQRLATAAGSIGSSADYLFRTRDGLRALDMWDELLEELAVEVEEAQRRLQQLPAAEFDQPRPNPGLVLDHIADVLKAPLE